jgi:hypothetical protein
VRGWLTGDAVSAWDGLLCLVLSVGIAGCIYLALRK